MKRITTKLVAIMCCIMLMLPQAVFATDSVRSTESEQARGYVNTENLKPGDTFEFGSYPQTEIVRRASDCGTNGKSWGSNEDYYIADEKLYSQLESNDGWTNNDKTINGVKYHRLKKEDTSSLDDGSGYYYNWNNGNKETRYFRYEPIKWRVLDNTVIENALVISETALDDQLFDIDGHTWKSSHMKTWLNSDFYNSAFSEAQKKSIIETSNKDVSSDDKVFLLSVDEAENANYFKEDVNRRVKSSTYAKAMGVSADIRGDGECNWWLRSPGGSHGGINGVAWVDNTGSVYDDIFSRINMLGVRPALRINLNSDALTPGGGDVSVVGQGYCKSTAVKWKLYSNGLLSIYGDGDIPDYDGYSSHEGNPAPWKAYNTPIKAIEFSGNVTSIGKSLFSGCSTVESISFNTTDIKIGDYAFNYCGSLRTIDFGTGAVRPGLMSFRYCDALTSILIPENVIMNKSYYDYSGYGLFESCKGLKEATVDCDYMGPYVFENSNLEKIVFNNPNTTFYCMDENGYTSGDLFNNCSPKIFGYECSEVHRYAVSRSRANSFITISGDKTIHKLKHVDSISATCELPGNVDYWVCSKCKMQFKNQNATEPLSNVTVQTIPHNFVKKDAVEATCVSKGYKEHYECGMCNSWFDMSKRKVDKSTLEMKATGVHKYDKEVVSEKYLKSVATCIEPAVYYKSCECGDVDKSEDAATFTSGDALSHNYTVVKNATCTVDGLKKCSRCDDEQVIPATKHDYKPNTEATCTKAATEKCSKCNDVQKVGNPLGHNLELISETSTMKAHYKCKRCDALFNDEDGQEPTDTEALKKPETGGGGSAPGPAPGGGGGGAPSTPSKDPVTNNKDENGNNKTDVNLNGSGSTGTDGKVDVKVDKDLTDQIINNVTNNGSASVDLNAGTTTGKADKTEVTIPTETLRKLYKTEKVDKVTIKTDGGTVAIDKTTMSEIINQAGSSDYVKLVVNINERAEDKVVFEVKLVTSNGEIRDLNDKKVTVTIPIEKTSGKKLVCVYTDENGKYTKLGGELTEVGFIFETSRFSKFEIMTEEAADALFKSDFSEAMVNGIVNKVYTGKPVKLNIVVTLGDKTLTDADYEVMYKNNTNVGLATVVITGKGDYEGEITKTFKITPKGIAVTSLKAQKKAIKVTWKKSAKKVSDYQVRYSTSKSFKNAKLVSVKYTKKINSETVKNLKSGKKYYVRVRTYVKTPDGKFYSAWSKSKSVKVK